MSIIINPMFESDPLPSDKFGDSVRELQDALNRRFSNESSAHSCTLKFFYMTKGTFQRAVWTKVSYIILILGLGLE